MLKTFIISILFLFCLSGVLASFFIIQKSSQKYCQDVNNFILERNEKIEKEKK